MKILRLSIITIISIITSCDNNKSNTTSPDNWDKQNIRSINIEDTAYLNAIKEAQQTIEVFTTFFLDTKDENYDFVIKAKFSEEEKVEHMWLTVDSIQDNSFLATLDNVPNKLKNVKYKDKRRIPKNDVEDWVIYYKDSAVLGNFIFNALIR